MLLYQIIVTFLLLIPFGVALWNLFTFAEIRRKERPKLTPKVSVLVPARNEERNIADCIASLLYQDYPDYEVIVLDDNSEDKTPELLRRLQAQRPDLTVIQGDQLPKGWIGKNWACWQLSKAAAGDFFIFTDADTRHQPESITACVAFAERAGAQFFSGVPQQTLSSFWEQVIIPMIQFLYFAYLPNRLITATSNPLLSAANGQLLCVTRHAYNKMGGHQAVKDTIVEDVQLGKEAKRHGIRSALAIASETVSCRMYTSLAEIIAGFSKNLFPGLGANAWTLIMFACSSLLLYVAPLFFVLYALITVTYSTTLLWLPLLHLLLATAIKGMIAYRFRIRITQVFLHPLAAAMAVVISINSARWYYSRSGMTWKGRQYQNSSGETIS